MHSNTIWPIQNFTCPHCHAVSAFSCVYSARGLYEGNWYPISVWACHSCDRAIFVEAERTEHDHVATRFLHIETKYPTTQPSVNAHIPPGIAADFIEAAKNLNIGSFKSSAVMARRTIQKMCLNLGATVGTRLVNQISELRINGKLHPDLAEMATEIRFFGNDGAHPENDGLDDISEDDAQEILDFTAELLEDLYVRPKKVAAMKERREQRKAAG